MIGTVFIVVIDANFSFSNQNGHLCVSRQCVVLMLKENLPLIKLPKFIRFKLLRKTQSFDQLKCIDQKYDSFSIPKSEGIYPPKLKIPFWSFIWYNTELVHIPRIIPQIERRLDSLVSNDKRHHRRKPDPPRWKPLPWPHNWKRIHVSLVNNNISFAK